MVVADADVEDGACELVLRVLQLLQVFISSTIQQGITVIHPGADDAEGNHVGYVTCEVTSNVTQCTDMKIARENHAVRMGRIGHAVRILFLMFYFLIRYSVFLLLLTVMYEQ